ncbi:MAG: hypothetical protein ACRCS9_14300 [Hyphomicrobium sp.]
MTEQPNAPRATTRAVAAAVSAVATVFMSFVAAAPVQAQANCDWYAQTALRQQQDNERLNCGLVGPAWTMDLKAHQVWCGGVAPDQMKAEAKAREDQLHACAAKKK